MKNLFRKSMFALSFLGLFTMGLPKSVCAENTPDPCHTAIITCPGGDSHYCMVCSGRDYVEAYSVICGVDLPDDY